MRIFSLGVCLASCFAANAALATTRVVTSTTDDINDTGSLRYMIQIADPGDTITFDLEYPAVIAISGSALPYPLLEIEKNLTITGPGADKLTIQAYTIGFSNYNIFDVDQSESTSCRSHCCDFGTSDGERRHRSLGHRLCVGTNYQTHLDVADVTCVNCIDGVDVNYGAIASIVRTTISGADTAINASSDAVDPTSVVTIADSTLRNNYAAIYGSYSSIKVTNSTLSGNGSLDDSITAAVIGDVNSTTTFVFTTIAGSPNVVTPGILAQDASAVFNLKNSLIAGHSGGNCAAASPVVSDDYNLSDDASCSLDGAHDVNDTPAGLRPEGLSWNGGPTQTIWLFTDKPGAQRNPHCELHRRHGQRGDDRSARSDAAGLWSLRHRRHGVGSRVQCRLRVTLELSEGFHNAQGQSALPNSEKAL